MKKQSIYFTLIILVIIAYKALFLHNFHGLNHISGISQDMKGVDDKAPKYVAANYVENDSSCEVVLPQWIKSELNNAIDAKQLIEVVHSLDQHSKLPSYYVTKEEAAQKGWEPGHKFQDISALVGKSIGGDRFGNFEKRLPSGSWFEADLDYHGGSRNAKRLIYGLNGKRFVTVDHYNTFSEVPKCQ